MKLGPSLRALLHAVGSFAVLHGTLVKSVTVEEAILQDVIPAGSPSCIDSGTTNFAFSFVPSPDQWAAVNQEFEEDVFLAEMNHQDVDPNRTWSMRLTVGGSIYSLIGSYGQAVPPQIHDHSAWVDDVSYMGVAVDTSKNFNPAYGDKPYYIHQAGTYMKTSVYNSSIIYDSPDYTPPAFYSPNVAKHCKGHSCSFASWGQHAHIPTPFKSDVLFLQQYRDCGNGVIEVTQAFQNGADPQDSSADTLTYLNTPWGGVRPTSLSDMLLSNPSKALEVVDPLQPFGQASGNEFIPNLEDTGGFTTFAQDYPTPSEGGPYDMPCYNDTVVKDWNDNLPCTEDDYNSGMKPLRLIIQKDNPCSNYNGPDGAYAEKGRPGAKCETFPASETLLESINAYCQNCNGGEGLLFTNNRTGEAVRVLDVNHWVFSRKTFFSSPDADYLTLNAMWKAGDELIVSTPAPMKEEDNLALTFVHGRGEDFSDPENTAGWRRKPRLRYGTTGSSRDFTVFTINSEVTLDAGKTFLYRQYLINDRLVNMESVARNWVNEVEVDMLDYSDFVGRKVELFSYHGDVFGAATSDQVGGNSTSCLQGTSQCVGSSTPTSGSKAFFAITCGSKSYFGPDKYFFAPAVVSSPDPIRAYACEGEATTERPSLKMLGYFPENDSGCASLQNAIYDPVFCTTESPSQEPSPKPSSVLSAVPSKEPTGAPTVSFNCLAVAGGKQSCNAYGPTEGCFWGNPDCSEATNSGNPRNKCCNSVDKQDPTPVTQTPSAAPSHAADWDSQDDSPFDQESQDDSATEQESHDDSASDQESLDDSVTDEESQDDSFSSSQVRKSRHKHEGRKRRHRVDEGVNRHQQYQTPEEAI